MDHLTRHDKVHVSKPRSSSPKPVEELDNCGDCVGCREMIKFGTQAVGAVYPGASANAPSQKRKCSFPIRPKPAGVDGVDVDGVDVAVAIDSVDIPTAVTATTTTTPAEDASEEEEEKEDGAFALKPKRKRRRDRSRASRDEHGRKKYFIEGVKVDGPLLLQVVAERGGFDHVVHNKLWNEVRVGLGLPESVGASNLLRAAYQTYSK